jgi:hypothetical protein
MDKKTRCLPAEMETQGPIRRDVVAAHSLSILGHYSLKVWAQEICKWKDLKD